MNDKVDFFTIFSQNDSGNVVLKDMQNTVRTGSRMSHDDIIEYAKSRGLKNVSLTNHPMFGWELSGDGTARNGCNGWPLVWEICNELGMGWGCGGPRDHQCKPERAKIPK